MVFEWDDSKERMNIKKHGIDFSIAATVFYDDDRLELYDEAHSIYEDRYITIGLVGGKLAVVTVVYTERCEAIRIISARLATKSEEKKYYDSKKEY